MLKFALIGAVFAAVGGFAAGWRVHDWRDASAAASQAAKAVRIVERQAAVSQSLAVRDQAAEDRIRTVTHTLVEKVPVYVTAQTDARFALPWGLVRLHDAAASGAMPTAAAGPFGPDDAASNVAASEAAALIAANYGTCRSDQQRLADLQAWARGEGLVK